MRSPETGQTEEENGFMKLEEKNRDLDEMAVTAFKFLQHNLVN